MRVKTDPYYVAASLAWPIAILLAALIVTR